jgi:hypothetical protein
MTSIYNKCHIIGPVPSALNLLYSWTGIPEKKDLEPVPRLCTYLVGLWLSFRWGPEQLTKPIAG